MQAQSLAMVQPQSFCESTFLGLLQDEIGSKNYDSWFKNKVSLKTEQDELSVGVGSPFLLNWMQKQFRTPLTKLARNFLGDSARVNFHVDAAMLEQSRAEHKQQTTKPALVVPITNTSASAQSREENSATVAAPRKAVPQQGHARRTGRKYASLADFISGESNQLAYTASLQACQFPGERFNPLYLHGNVGLGKSHLLEGMYKSMRQLHPSLNVMLINAESFANYFTLALRDRTLPSFRHKFRNVDILLVDDIDFLEDKKVIQEEFLHTFRQLDSKGCQIVLTSDRHPRLLTKTSSELSTRFLSGLVCKIESPDKTTREQIVQHKAQKMNSPLSKSVLRFIASRFQQNVRELEGALNCLETHRLMEASQTLSVNSARKILSDLERDCVRIVRMADVDSIVSEFFGITPEEIKSASRSRKFSLPRMIAIYLTRKLTEAAYKDIGQHFGGRNHSTVMSAERKVIKSLEQGSVFKLALKEWPARDLVDTLERRLLAS
ncbi:Chromosomal replication initiator protein DnaA [Polystyrenella longa]|uniref:Chromosomal replication initiator protein DnaA n=1 Tax=Polystyrenella longa TaxID=2528007 RepID=A0A518CHH3_9PLAN|nr:chromosomal replication initiator protein DnaA [Polystyrenella longa]QDU78678.1 Chromosomal replication initiator protein DnaA [Polystyrenella longa]